MSTPFENRVIIQANQIPVYVYDSCLSRLFWDDRNPFPELDKSHRWTKYEVCPALLQYYHCLMFQSCLLLSPKIPGLSSSTFASRPSLSGSDARETLTLKLMLDACAAFEKGSLSLHPCSLSLKSDGFKLMLPGRYDFLKEKVGENMILTSHFQDE